MHYVDEGEGEPIVCVHGNPTWSFYFREIVKNFSGTHRVIAPDHIGCGLSGKPGDAQYRYTLESRVDDLEALIDSLGLEQVNLVVHDWGGMIGGAWAVRNPGRVKSLVAANTAAFGLPEEKCFPWRLKFCRSAWPLNALAVQGFNAFAGLATRMATHKGLAPGVKAGLLAPYDTWKNRIATLRFVQDIPLRAGDRAWPIVNATGDGLVDALKGKPVMLLWGPHDFVFDMKFFEAWRARFPEAESHVFDDAGHYVFEDAIERIIPLLKEFWDDKEALGA